MSSVVVPPRNDDDFVLVGSMDSGNGRLAPRPQEQDAPCTGVQGGRRGHFQAQHHPQGRREGACLSRGNLPDSNTRNGFNATL